MPKQKAWGGIDPGLSGCACLLTPDRIWFHDFESEKMAVAKIEQWMEAFNVKFLLEKQVDVRTKKFSVSGKLLINYGFWRGLLTGLNCNFMERMPRTWQKIIPADKQKGEDTKDRALFWAKKFYPAASGFLLLKKNHNRADALLMAHFIREIEI
jgi:hypothetical protein